MNVVPYPNEAPSVCFICESVPPGLPHVDTFRNFLPSAPTHISGRKYLCESCVSEAAHAFGLFEDVKLPLENELAQLQHDYQQVLAELGAYVDMKSAIAKLTAPPTAPPEPKQPNPARAAIKAEATVVKAAKDQEKADAEAGAARQVVLDQEAADRQQASVEAAAKQPAVPVESGIPLPDLSPIIPVTEPWPDGKPGQVWNSATSTWEDPPVQAGDKSKK